MADDIIDRLRAWVTSDAWNRAVGEMREAAREIERLQVIVATVENLHSPRLNHDTCVECDHDWPCPTQRALHPKENNHE